METKKILRNASYLFVGNITVRFVLAIATILFARYAGVKDYGVLSVALALSAIVAYFTDAGLTHTFMREGRRQGANIGELVSSYLRIRLFLAVVISLLSIVFIENAYDEEYMRTIIYWIVLPTLFGATFQGVGMAYFQTTERMAFTAGISVLQGTMTSLALLLGMAFKWPLTFVAAMYGTASVVTGFVSLLLMLRYTTVHKGWNKHILDQLLTFTINGIIIMTLPQLGPLILEKVSTLSEVGYFSTAYKIPAVLYQIPGVIAAAFYPRLFSYGNEQQLEEHRRLSELELKLMSFLGMGIAFPFFAAPTFWIVSLLGEEWARSGEALAILSVMVILQSINYPLADHLTTKGQQIRRMITMTIGLAVAVTSYIFLGKEYGMIGGAFAAILTEVTLLIGFTLFINRGFSLLIQGVSVNILSFLTSYAMYYLVLRQLYPLIGVSVGTLLYAALVVLLDRQVRGKIQEFIAKKLSRRAKAQ